MDELLGNLTGGFFGETFDIFGLLGDMWTYIIKSANDATVNFTSSMSEMVNNLFFSYDKGYVGVIVVFHSLVGMFAAIVLVIITLKKGAQNLFDKAANGDSVPVTKLIMDVIKSCGLAVFLPWLTAFIMGVLPIFGKYILADAFVNIFYQMPGAGELKTSFGYFIPDDVAATLNGEWQTGISQLLNPGWWIFGTLFNLLVAIAFVCFVVRLCKFQVEMLIMDVTSIVAAIDSATDKKEFYELWIQSYKALIIDFIFNCLIFGLFSKCNGILWATPNPMASPYFVLELGAAACLMKGTILSNKFKQGGLAAGGVSAVANVARTAPMVLK